MWVFWKKENKEIVDNKLENQSPKKWESDFIVDEDFKDLNKEKMDFVLSETEKVLSKTLDNSEALENKSYIILGILFAIISGLIHFFAGRFNFKNGIVEQDWILLFPVLAWAGAYIVAAIFLIQSIKPMEYHAVGNEPINLLKKDVLSYDIIRILVSEIENRQGYISGNEKNNRIKAHNIILGLIIIFTTPICSLILALLLRYAPNILAVLSICNV
jgi:hypothetical protein